MAAEIEKHTKLARVFINACNKEFEIIKEVIKRAYLRRLKRFARRKEIKQLMNLINLL